MSAPSNNKGLRRVFNAFHFSIAGYRACFEKEEAFRQEVILALLMIPLALWLGSSGTERLILIGAVVLVLIVELLNTAIERAIDRISADRHELSKEAKDMGSAAVMTALIFAGFVWAVIVIPKILAVF